MDVFTSAPFNVGSIVWQEQPDQWTLTVVCKATYTLAPGTSPLAKEAEAINESDNHWDDDPQRSLYAPSDLAPQKPRPEVLLVGSAYAPRGDEVRSLLARLVVGTVDKSIEVIVPRTLMRDGAIREGAPWKRMPLRYERAAGGAGTWNPVGMDASSVDRHGRGSLPNLQPPGLGAVGAHDAIEPVGFGPIASTWSLRRDKLGDRPTSDGRWDGEPIGADFDADYFQAAPLDQLIDELHADEAIVLENLHPDHADLVTRLPGLRPTARVEAPDLPAWDLALVADTLWIDTDRSLCTLTWRGQIPLSERDAPGLVRIGIEEPEKPARAPLPSAPSVERFNAGAAAPFAPFTSDAVDEGSPELSHTAVDDHLLAVRAMPAWLKPAAPEAAAIAPMPPRIVPPPAMLFSSPREGIEANGEAKGRARPPERGPAAPAYVGVLQASNAAAGAPQSPAVTSARRELPSSADRAARALQELVWFDPEALPRLREDPTWAGWMGPPPAPAPPDDAAALRAHARAERAGVAAVLARAAGSVDIEAAVAEAIGEDEAFEPPLCVAAGELEIVFDEIETLKLLVAAAGPLAPGDKRLKEVIDQAGEVMKTPLGGSPEVAAGFIPRLRDAWAKASRILPADYLDHHTRRLLLDQRLYQKRKLSNAAWIRALFTPVGASAAIPLYLPEAIGPSLPLFTRFSARIIAEAVPQQDQHEACAVALRACALARVVAPKPRARS